MLLIRGRRVVDKVGPPILLFNSAPINLIVKTFTDYHSLLMYAIFWVIDH